MGYRPEAAAAALAISRRAYYYLEYGHRQGQPRRIDRRTALACLALYHRLAPWGTGETVAAEAVAEGSREQ